MFELEPYFCDLVAPIECLHGIDNIIIDVIGIHFLRKTTLVSVTKSIGVRTGMLQFGNQPAT